MADNPDWYYDVTSNVECLDKTTEPSTTDWVPRIYERLLKEENKNE